MNSSEHNTLRATFNEAADLYDRVRPQYPSQMFEDLSAFLSLGPGTRVLEIGPGTGQATIPLAKRGCEIVAIELGSDMAAVARRNTAEFSCVTVITSSFEDWQLPTRPFDLVFSATAFHWIDPAIRVAKAADALRAGGTLAIIGTHHIAGGDETFFVDVQDCYTRWDPTAPSELRLPTASEIGTDAKELSASVRFGPVIVRQYEHNLTYSTGEYLDLLRTYSGHLALGPEARANLLRCIAKLIDTRYGGRISKRYLFQMQMARLI